MFSINSKYRTEENQITHTHRNCRPIGSVNHAMPCALRTWTQKLFVAFRWNDDDGENDEAEKNEWTNHLENYLLFTRIYSEIRLYTELGDSHVQKKCIVNYNFKLKTIKIDTLARAKVQQQQKATVFIFFDSKDQNKRETTKLNIDCVHSRILFCQAQFHRRWIFFFLEYTSASVCTYSI